MIPTTVKATAFAVCFACAFWTLWKSLSSVKDGPDSGLILMFMIYITIMLTSIVTLLYLHINGHLDLVHIFGRNFADVDNEHRSSKMFREQRERTAWERSRKKKELGYYQGHQGTGGYKDGLKTDDYQMNGPKKLDPKQAATIRQRSKRPPSHSAKLPDDAGTKILKYSWEDSDDMVKIYVTSLPGFDSWEEARVSKEGCSAYWDDRESLLLMISSDNGESYHLHIPSLYKDVNDVQCVWKKNKCIVKIYKRVDEPWPTIDKKPVESKRGEDEMWEEGDVGGGRKSKFMDKSKLPFGDDLNDYVDRVGGGDIDIDSKVRWE